MHLSLIATATVPENAPNALCLRKKKKKDERTEVVRLVCMK